MPPAPLPVDVLRERLVDRGPLARLDVVAETGSTNDDLAALAATWPAPALLVAEHQRGGHGRLGRTWTAPAGTAVLASALLRPRVPVASLGWLPALAGLAVARAVRRAGAPAVLKWPNDVLVPAAPGAGREDLPGWGDLRKVAGVLARATPDGIVAGWGINVGQGAADLPVPSATSLALAGARADRAEVLAATVEELCVLLDRWESAGGDASAAGIAAECAAANATVGSPVRVELADGATVTGEAVGLAPDAALLVATPGGLRTVHAGDVLHLRRPPG